MSYDKKENTMKTCIKKEISIPITIIILALLLLSTTQAQVSHSVYFNKSDLSLKNETAKDGGEYEVITLGNLNQTSEEGKPQLPLNIIKLIIPTDQQVVNIKINKITKEEISGYHLIYPAQPPMPSSDDSIEPEFVNPDPIVYESDNPYPSEAVKVLHHGYFDGNNHIVTLAVYPLCYYPKSGRLEFISNIGFTLEMGAASLKSTKPRNRLERNQAIYDVILKSIVANPQDIALYQSKPTLNKSAAMQNGSVPFYEYIIVVDSSLDTYFDEFINWKKRKGLYIGIVTIQEVLANYTSGDQISGINDPAVNDAGNLRQYLYEAWQEGAVWALLVGDYTALPIMYGWARENTDDNDYIIPADLYFSDFTGNWNDDNDIYYGEQGGDNPDYNPEIFVGRLLCSVESGEQDIKYWTDKVIIYEQNSGKGDPSYLSSSFMIQSDQFQRSDYASMVASELPSGFTHTIWEENPTYNDSFPTFPFGNQFISEINNTNYGLLSWFGHGSPTKMVAKSSVVNEFPKSYVRTYSNMDAESGNGLDSLNNNFHPSIVYSCACDNNPFDDFSTSAGERNLGEGFTVISKAGGPSFLGNTRWGYIYSSSQLYKKFAEILTQGSNDSESGQSFYHIGVAEMVSKQQYNNHYLLYSHNLVGCPEMMIWTDIPDNFASAVVTDNSNSLTVNSNVDSCTIAVCSMDNGASFFEVVSNASSHTFNTSVRPLYVTISKENYLPFIGITGGTITSDINFFGALTVLADITVSNSATLKIDPGAIISFKSGAGITVSSGSLSAGGESGDEIIFSSSSSSPSANDWDGITISGSGASASFNHCKVEYAAYSISFTNGAAGTVDSSHIKNNTVGLYCSSAQPVISGNNINANSYGIRILDSYSQNWNSVHIAGNTINNNTSYGVYLSNSSPTLSDNNISDNIKDIYAFYTSNPILNENLFSGASVAGIICYQSASPDVYYNSTYSFGGYNSISNNSGHGVKIMNNSCPNLGSSNTSFGGYNSILDNTGYEIYNLTPNTIYACNNWWGNSSGPQTGDLFGLVDWQPALSSAPSGGGGGGGALAKSSDGGFTPDANSDMPVDLQEAYHEQMSAKYDDSSNRFKKSLHPRKRKFLSCSICNSIC